MKLTANNAWPTRLRPGQYRFTEPVMVARYHGDGDGKRMIEYCTVKEIEISNSVNQFWFGVQLTSCEFVDGFQERNVLGSYTPKGNNRTARR